MTTQKNGKKESGRNELHLKKPKRKARVERMLKKKEPLIVENTKKALFIRGHNTSQVTNVILKDLAMLCKPYSKALQRKNEIFPFEDCQSLEFLSTKNDCSLFAFGSHTKKRPHNLILGRLFDGELLDMVEFGTEVISTIELACKSKGVGSKPMFVFLGSHWESDSTYARIQNLLTDFFRGDKVDKISLQGLDHVLVFTVSAGLIYMRPFAVSFERSGTRIPHVELIPMGKHLSLRIRRTQLASDEVWKVALKAPKSLTPKVKNKKKTDIGETLGRIHLKKQNLSNMTVKRVRALRASNQHPTE